MSLAPHELSQTPPSPVLPLEPELVTQDPNEDLTPPTPARISAARIAIAMAIAITVAALALIFYRSLSVVEPTSAVMVIADATYDGTEIVVKSDMLSADATEARATLSAENNYQTPVLLRPGVYWITITHKGELVLRKKIQVQAYQGEEYLLGAAAQNRARNVAAGGPASAG